MTIKFFEDFQIFTLKIKNGHIRFRKASDLHWLELAKDEEGNNIPCTSIFFMGRKQKEWGFVRWVKHVGYRWIHNEEYLKGADGGNN